MFNWNQQQDSQLKTAVENFGSKQWLEISSFVKDRNPLQCYERWNQIKDHVQNQWSKQEDDVLIKFVSKQGVKAWSKVNSVLPGRNPKQCLERWNNILSPKNKRGNWSGKEDEIIFKLYKTYGSSWAKIANFLPGRTQNSIKNRFYSTMKKMLVQKDSDLKLRAPKEDLDAKSNNLFQMLI